MSSSETQDDINSNSKDMAAFFILIILSLLIVAGFTVYAVKTIGYVPTCLSATYYLLPKHKVLFRIAMIAAGFLALPAWLEASPENWQFLAFLGCAGLVFIGAAPAFLDHFEGKVHYTATAIAAASAVLWLTFASEWGWIALLGFVLCAIPFVAKKPKNWLFWAEMAVLASTYTGIMISLSL